MKARVIVTGGSGFIGCFLVKEFIKRNYEVLNIDVKEPVDGVNTELRRHISVTNYSHLKEIFESFNPDFVVHLAAIATQDAESLEDFEVNISGTRNIIRLINEFSYVKKVIYTSTQYVHQPGITIPSNLEEYRPYGLYGKSKLIGEFEIHAQSTSNNWLIIRPTAIWGPFHPVLTDGLWKQIELGRYFHPTNDNCTKPYGYVENTVWQIVELLEKEDRFTQRQTYYLADGHYKQLDWVKRFVKSLDRKFISIPRSLLFLIALLGDILISRGYRFPLYSSRYRNLLQSNEVPLSNMQELVGQSPIALDDGVSRTVRWLITRDSRLDN